ncbi:MAG TPA: bifunctional phosphopantothenoylcysteine decarboxylase/phosphopantothenate--cysteine ligase CoaBC [Gemmatimonadota bacterium]|nr:bifunctional phosphopantothenoylcysteine decarboxylase/phosphopantothenate--cysteine ligase CoaBC [Gemmatimonadota bacterium]
MRALEGRRVLLVVTGGIAAYKSADLVRRLREAGAEVRVVLTDSARRFVGPVTFEALSGSPVLADVWERPLAHIELGKEADVAVVAPATADFLARMAAGRADDLAGAALLAAACPVVACPAMNTRMWKHPATRENVATLRERGVHLVGPEEGELAEGETGMGRMSEPPAIVAETARVLGAARSPLSGLRVVVTAGPTRAPLDPVRFVSNGSSGRMGFALAAAAWRRGADVRLVAGPTTVEPPHGPALRRVRESSEMLEALREELDGAALLLMAAAVGDFVAGAVSDRKIKKGSGPLELTLEPGPDLLAETRSVREEEGVLSLGFALETDAGEKRALEKLREKGLDFIALNEAGAPDTGMEAETNRVTLFDRWGGCEEMPLLRKEEVAERILERIEERLEDRDDGRG